MKVGDVVIDSTEGKDRLAVVLDGCPDGPNALLSGYGEMWTAHVQYVKGAVLGKDYMWNKDQASAAVLVDIRQKNMIGTYGDTSPCPSSEIGSLKSAENPWTKLKLNIEAYQAEKAIRHNAGKLQWSLVDESALEDMVRVLGFGAQKYSPDNWKKGMSVKTIYDSMRRHEVAFMGGEDLDPESGLPHTAHILCNAMFLAWMVKNKPEFDNR